MRDLNLSTAEAILPSLGSADPGSGLARLFGAIGLTLPPADASQPYRTFLEALAVAVYTTDAEGRITFFNEAAVDLWGRRPELGDEWCGSLRLFHRDGRPMAHAECPMAIALKENRAVRGQSAIALRPDGREVVFEPYPTPLRSEDGTLVGAVNVLVEVTERVAAEDALRRSAEALESSNRVKDEFLGLISHELRTPVTSIYGNASFLTNHLALGEPEAGMVRDIGEDADRLMRVVENLLQLTRLGAGVTVDREPQVLGHVVRDAVASRLRRDPGRPIEVAAPSSSIVVDAERVALDMVLENLLSNADKYSPPGAPIRVEIELHAATATVRILDRGIGIPEDVVDDVFDAFFRTEWARRTAGGIGVGLAVCKRIIDAHDGRIWARPRDGGGAEIGFELSLSNDPDVNAG
jgi:PAS domain S-box-containing protein